LFLKQPKSKDKLKIDVYNPDRLIIDHKYKIAAAKVVPYLIKILKDIDDRVRGNAIYSLGFIGSESESAVPNLIKCLSDKSDIVKIRSIVALGLIGDKAKVSIPYLEKLTRNNDEKIKKFSQISIMKIRGN
jgi:HEAT repeat protein